MTFDELVAFAGRNMFLSMALAGLTLAIIVTEFGRLTRGYRTLAPAGLTALVNREDAVVIDVSASGDFEKGHIAGARSLPSVDFKPDHKRLPASKTTPVVLTCRTGMASAKVAAQLKKGGYEQVHWLDGGVAAWQQAGLPLVKGRG